MAGVFVVPADSSGTRYYQDCSTKLNTDLSNGGIGYTYLPDGTMMQWGMVGENIVTNNSKNAVKIVTFPLPFSTASGCPATVTVQNEHNTYIGITLVDTITQTSFRAILQGAASANTSTTTRFRWFAIGKWK